MGPVLHDCHGQRRHIPAGPDLGLAVLIGAGGDVADVAPLRPLLVPPFTGVAKVHLVCGEDAHVHHIRLQVTRVHANVGTLAAGLLAYLLAPDLLLGRVPEELLALFDACLAARLPHPTPETVFADRVLVRVASALLVADALGIVQLTDNLHTVLWRYCPEGVLVERIRAQLPLLQLLLDCNSVPLKEHVGHGPLVVLRRAGRQLWHHLHVHFANLVAEEAIPRSVLHHLSPHRATAGIGHAQVEPRVQEDIEGHHLLLRFRLEFAKPLLDGRGFARVHLFRFAVQSVRGGPHDTLIRGVEEPKRRHLDVHLLLRCSIFLPVFFLAVNQRM
mmetsp:Transcript_4402/g.10076  ORF Transcript_4402/g.10076 Transcript_4402/m.10076 type:complete len:331 (-) Transcript_4402:206-1198(-)